MHWLVIFLWEWTRCNAFTQPAHRRGQQQILSNWKLLRYRGKATMKTAVTGIGSMQRCRSEIHPWGLRPHYMVRAIPIYILQQVPLSWHTRKTAKSKCWQPPYCYWGGTVWPNEGWQQLRNFAFILIYSSS